jgi:XTP/dITP diphosphohydrolase
VHVALASRNPGKLRELRALLPSWGIQALDVSRIGEEEGSTFLENALAKARFARDGAPSDAWALGEDSGLEVDGLGGQPGIRSARFAGPDATDEENVAKLLRELHGRGGSARRARYTCALAIVSPGGEELTALGMLEGEIAQDARGHGGFGYDPVFVPRGERATVAELGDAWKAAHSHRSRAARALAKTVSGEAPL